jgi:hypothetical protein
MVIAAVAPAQVCQLLALTLDLIDPWRARKASRQATALDVSSSAPEKQGELTDEFRDCG